MAALKWNGDAYRAKVEAIFQKRLEAAAMGLAAHAKKLISTEGATAITRRTKAGRNRYVKLRYNTTPSRPGEPPHVQTGRLRASVTWERDGQVARVGTNVKYGRWLELGTMKMAARPWLRRSLQEFTPRILQILEGRGFEAAAEAPAAEENEGGA